MRTIITTAIAAFMFICTTNGFANNTAATVKNADAHRHEHNVMVRVTPTHRCNCHTCHELMLHARDIRFANAVRPVPHCNCPTCNDIRHNEIVRMRMEREHMHHHTTAPDHRTPAPAPRPMTTPRNHR